MDGTATPQPIRAVAGVQDLAPDVDLGTEPPQYPADHYRESVYFALTDAVGALDTLAGLDAMTVGDLADLLRVIRDAKRDLSDTERAVENRLGQEMGAHQITVMGVGTVERHTRKSRTQWKKDELLHDVLDTVMVVGDTGEVISETPLEKVLSVWNLPSPRTGVLRDRGLDPDQYCTVEDQGGYTIRLTVS
jgi:hypothetical protein